MAAAGADATDSAPESDVEIELDVGADDSAGTKADASKSGESETIMALKLKLQLAQAERLARKEKAQVAEAEWLREGAHCVAGCARRRIARREGCWQRQQRISLAIAAYVRRCWHFFTRLKSAWN